jgi:hypothetical protein
MRHTMACSGSTISTAADDCNAWQLCRVLCIAMLTRRTVNVETSARRAHLLEEDCGGGGVGAQIDVREHDGALRRAAQLLRRPVGHILPVIIAVLILVL